ncbi:MAG: sulfotransferase [Nannocystaceae bacterium]
MTVQVIGAGFGRTGTLSMKAALERLGFDRCHHMSEVFAHPETAAIWDAANRGEPVDWRGLLAGYRATVDWPSCTFYRELMAVYPDAKVVLTIRDPERWYESVHETIYRLSTESPWWLARIVPLLGVVTGMARRLVWVRTFGGRFEDRAHALAVWRAHIAEVKATVPPERLLVYEVSEGWGPLCEFLGVPVPDEPFPRLNDRAVMLKRVRFLRTLRFGAPIVFAVVVIALWSWFWGGG